MRPGPVNVVLNADQVVAAYNSVETEVDMNASHRVLDAACHTFTDNDRGRVARTLIAAVSRLKTLAAQQAARSAAYDTAS